MSARCGVAAALRALAPELGPEEVPAALDFLIGNGLADVSEKVRACAGVGVFFGGGVSRSVLVAHRRVWGRT